MNEFTRTMPWMGVKETGTEPLITREWLVTNGLGGYASGSISGIVTRRYHGVLIAALPSPFGRIVMLNHLSEHVVLENGTVLQIGAEQSAENMMEIPGAGNLTGFRLEHGLPAWRFELDGVIIDKHIVMLHMQNTVHVSYTLIANPHPGTVRLELRPSMHFRSHEAPVTATLHEPYVLKVTGHKYEISSSSSGLPPLHMLMHGDRTTFVSDKGVIREVFYRIEAERGYDSRGVLWSPGYFTAELSEHKPATFVASTESWSIIEALDPAETSSAERERRKRLLGIAKKPAQTSFAAELVMAADQFIITPAGRIEDAARAHASGDEVRTIIAGYHWFTDWGRDTMISLEGLTLTTGRTHEAGWILRTFAHYVNDGLIPNLFPEGEKEGLYHTADATLWYFHALHRYIEETGDRETLKQVLPKLESIIQFHMRGTKFGIGADPNDGLLKQGQEGYQLTWMDAKVEDWVVTPRRGKAVEINALWYNALRLLIRWLKEERGDDAAADLEAYAQRVYDSFNARFWYEKGGYLFDVVDGEKGDDPSMRPNQVFAISLPYPVLDEKRWASVMKMVEENLLTPLGLRTLAPADPEYKAKYFGDLRARDAAYHQGTVWAWLIGPFIDAWLKVNGHNINEASKFLSAFSNHLNEACIGTVSEIFDAETPFTPRGCIAQAWSVAEVLRAIVMTSEEAPAPKPQDVRP